MRNLSDREQVVYSQARIFMSKKGLQHRSFADVFLRELTPEVQEFIASLKPEEQDMLRVGAESRIML